jgi:hypothetical protein
MNCDLIKIWVIIVLIGWAIPVLGLDREEKTAVQAIKAGDVELLKSYLEKHPDLNCKFSNGKTGLYYAIVYDQFKISEFLLKRGADPDFIVDDHSTLKWAIRNGRVRIARLLIEYGAEVNKPDKELNTPLIYAAELNNLEMCKILIDRGADPLHTNLKNKRASDYAYYFNESSAYKYLLSMEKQCQEQDSIPSMHDGPYIFLEADGQVVLTYYERLQDKNLTRLIEKTIETGKSDTIVEGIGRDKNSYHIKYDYTPNADNITTAGNIFVVGDIHGRYDALVNLLINNKIINSELKWIFGEGQLVLLGDVFDRGDLVTETLWFLYDLQFQARRSGGNVHLLLGNHEIMALTGDDRYLNNKYNYFTQYTQIYYFQLFEKNTVLGKWLRSQNIIVRINDFLFVHAGISPNFAIYDFAYSDVNSTVRKYLNSDYRIGKGSPESIILGPFGPQWYRCYFSDNINNNDNDNDKYDGNDNKGMPEVTQQFVDDYLYSKGLKRMILGHNEQLEINTSFKGKVITADVAIDESGKSAQGLLISGDNIFRCFSDGRKERID